MTAEWTPERLRALDREVFLVLGWRVYYHSIPGEFGTPREVWLRPDGALQELPPVSFGCREMFDLLVIPDIVGIVPTWIIVRKGGVFHRAPTLPITWCLAFLGYRGRNFKW